MHDSKVVTIDNVLLPLTGNILDYLIAKLIPGIWYASPPYAIFNLLEGFRCFGRIFSWYLGQLVFHPYCNNPRGRVVTLLINSGVISMERPLKVIVACVLIYGTKEWANS